MSALSYVTLPPHTPCCFTKGFAPILFLFLLMNTFFHSCSPPFSVMVFHFCSYPVLVINHIIKRKQHKTSANTLEKAAPIVKTNKTLQKPTVCSSHSLNSFFISPHLPFYAKASRGMQISYSSSVSTATRAPSSAGTTIWQQYRSSPAAFINSSASIFVILKYFTTTQHLLFS